MIRGDLRASIKRLSMRGMRRSAEWCAEQLQGLDDEEVEEEMREVDETMSDAYLCAKTYFDLQEYERSANILKQSSMLTNPLDVFLCMYATYLSGERKKEEAIREGNSTIPINERLRDLIKDLTAYTQRDAFCDWLLGICLKQRGGQKDLAKESLLRSVIAFPYNWSCWLDLYQLCAQDKRDLTHVLESTPESWPKRFFQAHVEIWTSPRPLSSPAASCSIDELCEVFPKSPFAIGQKATWFQRSHDYETAYTLFKELLLLDPYRLTGIDTFSNVLVLVDGGHAELSRLAHHAFRVDRHRAETCTVMGEYYSGKGEWTKAVTYYKRALRQNRKNMSSLILLGLAFLELKNPPAAIEAFRQAVDVDPSDSRAWYNLGYAYELLNMNYYSIHYYSKSLAIAPNDGRFLGAMGKNYEQIGRRSEAIKCYQRAEAVGDGEECNAIFRLAKLHESDEPPSRDSAFKCYATFLKRWRAQLGIPFAVMKNLTNETMMMDTLDAVAVDDEDNESQSGQLPDKQDFADAFKFVAGYLKEKKRYEQALIFAEKYQRVADSKDRGEADSLFKELAALIGQPRTQLRMSAGGSSTTTSGKR